MSEEYKFQAESAAFLARKLVKKSRAEIREILKSMMATSVLKKSPMAEHVEPSAESPGTPIDLREGQKLKNYARSFSVVRFILIWHLVPWCC
jgi:hypothetical protein